MNRQPVPDERWREATARLIEIDRLLDVQQGAIRALRVEIALRRKAIVTLRTERRAVRMELARTRARIKVGLQQEVMARVATGMSVREIARALHQRPAVVSRLIEQAKAAERKQQKKRTHSETRRRP